MQLIRCGPCRHNGPLMSDFFRVLEKLSDSCQINWTDVIGDKMEKKITNINRSFLWNSLPGTRTSWVQYINGLDLHYPILVRYLSRQRLNFCYLSQSSIIKYISKSINYISQSINYDVINWLLIYYDVIIIFDDVTPISCNLSLEYTSNRALMAVWECCKIRNSRIAKRLIAWQT